MRAKGRNLGMAHADLKKVRGVGRILWGFDPRFSVDNNWLEPQVQNWHYSVSSTSCCASV